MKRDHLLTVYARDPVRVYGSVTTSSLSALRETLHEALDVWIDELDAEINRLGTAISALQTSPVARLEIHVQ